MLVVGVTPKFSGQKPPKFSWQKLPPKPWEWLNPRPKTPHKNSMRRSKSTIRILTTNDINMMDQPNLGRRDILMRPSISPIKPIPRKHGRKK